MRWACPIERSASAVAQSSQACHTLPMSAAFPPSPPALAAVVGLWIIVSCPRRVTTLSYRVRVRVRARVRARARARVRVRVGAVTP